MSEKHALNSAPPGWVDMLISLVLFVLLTLALKSVLDAAIPGLLKDNTLTQIQLSGILFIVFWAVAGNRFFKPYIDVVVLRESSSYGAEQQAKARREETALLEEKIWEAIRDERLQLLSKRDELLAEARQRAQREIEKAEEAASKKRARGKTEVEKLKEQAHAGVQAEAEQLASLVVERALSEAHPAGERLH